MHGSTRPTDNRGQGADRLIFFRTAAAGVRVLFFNLVIKVDSLGERYGKDVHSFLRTAGGSWETDGQLLSACSMTCDFKDVVTLLESHRMQCEDAPVDFYITEAGFGAADVLDTPTCLTRDDGRLQFFTDGNGKTYCRLIDCSESLEPKQA